MSIRQPHIKRPSALAVFLTLAVICLVVQLLGTEVMIGLTRSHAWLKNLTADSLFRRTLNHIGDALILLSPFVFLPAKWRKWAWTVIWLVTIWCFAQFIYFPIYLELMPFSSFLLWGNLDRMVIDSITGSIRLLDIFIVIPPVLLYIAWRWKLKKRVESEHVAARKRVVIVIAFIAAFVALQGIAAFSKYRRSNEFDNFKDFTIDKYTSMAKFSRYFTGNGFVPLSLYCLATTINDNSTLDEEQVKQVETFLNSQPRYTDNTHAPEQQANLVFIIVESLNSWAIHLEIDNRKVAPVLDSLARDGSSIVGLKMKTQVKNGRSSDGVFMYNTGLLPLVDNAVATIRDDAVYPSLPKALDGYDNIYICIDNPRLWNVGQMTANYGYKRFISHPEMRPMLEKCRFMAVDSVIFDVAGKEIPGLTPPFLATVTTAGMHSPYNSPGVKTGWITRSAKYSTPVLNYLERVAALDRELGKFIQLMKDRGCYDNTIFVIASDHTEAIDYAANGRPALDPEGDNCTLIILNAPGGGKRLEKPFGQIDVFPTVLDLIGANNYRWKGLGYSLMRHDITSAATSPQDVYPKTETPLAQRQMAAWNISRLLILSRYFGKNNKP